MSEEVKYTEQDLERALKWFESVKDQRPIVGAAFERCIAELIHSIRAEAQQANHLTAAVNARLDAAERLAQLIPSHVATIREFEEHSNDSGDPMGGCGKCLGLFERLLKEAAELESAWKAAGK